MTPEQHSQLKDRLHERVKRLRLTACMAEIPALRRVGVELVLDCESLAELLAALGLEPAGVCPRLMDALRTLLSLALHRKDKHAVARLPFGEFMALMGAALRVELGDQLLKSLGEALTETAEALDEVAPHSSEVLSLIGTDIVESCHE